MAAVDDADPRAGFDPFDPDQRGTHHEVMAELRARCPVTRLDSGMVILTRHGDAHAALTERTDLVNARAARAPGVDVPPEDRLLFFEYDPPEHPRLRRLLLDLLSRSRVERDAHHVRALAEELVGGLVAAGGGEVVSRLSVPLSGRTMMRVAGFPTGDAPRWRAWIRDMVVSGFSFTNANERGTGFAACYPEVLAYLDEHLAARAREANPPDDVLTRVVRARVDGGPLSRTHQRMILFSVVSAGTNTLVNFVSNTLLSLARDPGLVAALRADHSLVPAAVEESLRRDAPSMYITRVCAEPTEVGGVPVEPGDKLLVGLGSANRDESVYPQADEFRLDRDGQPAHLAFGAGSHLCLGAPLTRVVGATLLDTVLDRVGTIEVEPGTVPVPYLSVQGYGLDELRVRLTPADSGHAGRA